MSKTTHTPVVARLTIAQLAVGLLAAVATAFVLGGLTSFGQMLLPDVLQSFANSGGLNPPTHHCRR